MQDVAEVVEHDANVLGVGFNVVKPLERVSGLGPGRQGIGRVVRGLVRHSAGCRGRDVTYKREIASLDVI